MGQKPTSPSITQLSKELRKPPGVQTETSLTARQPPTARHAGLAVIAHSRDPLWRRFQTFLWLVFCICQMETAVPRDLSTGGKARRLEIWRGRGKTGKHLMWSELAPFLCVSGANGTSGWRYDLLTLPEIVSRSDSALSQQRRNMAGRSNNRHQPNSRAKLARVTPYSIISLLKQDLYCQVNFPINAR